jgi:hypothetical protein
VARRLQHSLLIDLSSRTEKMKRTPIQEIPLEQLCNVVGGAQPGIAAPTGTATMKPGSWQYAWAMENSGRSAPDVII